MEIKLNDKVASGLAEFINTFGGYINIFLAFLIVTLIILFVYHATALAKAVDNPIKRQQAMNGLFVIGGCIAVTGSFGFVYGLLLAFLFIK